MKTLKDIEARCCGSGEYCLYDGDHYEDRDKANSVHSIDLRLEAKNWIKELRKDKNMNFFNKIPERDRGEFYEEWIKYFFNL